VTTVLPTPPSSPSHLILLGSHRSSYTAIISLILLLAPLRSGRSHLPTPDLNGAASFPQISLTAGPREGAKRAEEEREIGEEGDKGRELEPERTTQWRWRRTRRRRCRNYTC
jgi:hypothetical protein